MEACSIREAALQLRAWSDASSETGRQRLAAGRTSARGLALLLQQVFAQRFALH
jgi:hypothetical protein